jgi:hypothetical protein
LNYGIEGWVRAARVALVRWWVCVAFSATITHHLTEVVALA